MTSRLPDELDQNARVAVRKNSTGTVWRRRRLNLIEGTGITLTVADDPAGEEVDVTPSIASNAISNAMLRDSAANSVIGRATNSAGDPADIAATTTDTFLGLTGTTLGFTSPPGRLVSVTVITAGTTTYTKPAGVTRLWVRGIGAGGGGGGGDGAANSAGVGGGGGAGAYFEKVYTGLSSSQVSVTVAVGTGGAGGPAGPNGGAAGSANTVFDSGNVLGGGVLTAPVGSGGSSMTSGTAVAWASGGAGGTTATGGNVNAGGRPGGPGLRNSGTVFASGIGASSQFGAGGQAIYSVSSVGNNAVGYGAGGGGGAANSATDRAGGNGGNGVIYVLEFT